MRVYIYFICFYCIHVDARNYVLRVPKGMSQYFMDPEIIASLVNNFKRNTVPRKTFITPQRRLQNLFDIYETPIKYLKEQFPYQEMKITSKIENENNFHKPKIMNIIYVPNPSIREDYIPIQSFYRRQGQYYDFRKQEENPQHPNLITPRINIEPQSRNQMFNKYSESVKYIKKPFPSQDIVRQLANQEINQFQRPLSKTINLIRIDKPSVQDENLFPSNLFEVINSIDSKHFDYSNFRRQVNENEKDDESPDDGPDKKRQVNEYEKDDESPNDGPDKKRQVNENENDDESPDDGPDKKRQVNGNEKDDESPDDGPDKKPLKKEMSNLQAEDMKKGFVKLANCFKDRG